MSGEQRDIRDIRGDAAARSRPAVPAAPAGAEPQWYLEGGFVVFTAAHHLARGTCCGSGCRHCPFDPPHAAGGTKVR
jgi:hypothetical protein